MKKFILAIVLFCCITLATTAQDTTAAQQQPETEEQQKAKTSPAVWIGVGVVFVCVFIAMNKKKMRKHKE